VKKIFAIAFATAQIASAFALVACDSKSACQNAYPQASLERACRRGADEIAPHAKGDIKLADAECVKIYARAETPIGDADAGLTLYDPDRDVRDLYNACHFGATGFMVAVEGQDAGKVQAAGCEAIAGPGGTRCY
jgi:hypothetical protein